MKEIKNLLEKREKYLLQIKNEKEKAVLAAPDGALRIISARKKPQYYQRDNPKDFSGVYIREKDIYIARELAQKIMTKKS